MSFRFEKDLVETIIGSIDFWENIKGKYYPSKFDIEVAGLFGIPDLVVLQELNSNRIRSIAFEMKLSNWRRALIQAYRYRSFAERSVVMLDHARAKSAIKNIHDFIRSNVGLMSVNDCGDVFVHYFPRKEVPFSSHLHSKMIGFYPSFKQKNVSRKYLLM